MTQMPPIVVVVGPTGAGKSQLAMELAETVGGEIVSADSQQVYRGMDIGTGKVSASAREQIPHHLLDIVDPNEKMTAAQFATRADGVLQELARRAVPCIVAGGTGLYVRALLDGLFEGPAADLALRARLTVQAQENGIEALWAELHQVDPESAARIHKTDLTRTIRALEVYLLTGVPLSEHHRQHREQQISRNARLIGLCPERSMLYRQIDNRVDNMLKLGLVAEVESLRADGYGLSTQSQKAIGYAEIHRYLDGITSLDDAVRLIKRNSRRYARRQLSWYRRDSSVQWHQKPSEVDLPALGRYLSANPGARTDDR